MRDEPLTHSFTTGKHDEITILKLSGPLTISTMFGFQNELRAVKTNVLIIDMSETPYMDSAGLGSDHELSCVGTGSWWKAVAGRGK